MSFAAAEQIADAVLYEGYALYPYRASSAKNRVRWQFGVLAPRAYAEQSGSDPWFAQTECLVEPAGAPALDVRVRGLQVQSRTIEVAERDGRFIRVPSARAGDREIVEWDEGVERTLDLCDLALEPLSGREHVLAATIEPGRDVEPVAGAMPAIRIVRERAAVRVRVVVSAERAGARIKVRVRVENVTEPAVPPEGREAALKEALVGTHTLIAVRDGRFVSMFDPPAAASEAAAACANVHTWPVLVGDPQRQDLVLSSPIILYDYPAIAPESPGNLFDATEIDEILTLRIMTLTDEEKAEARATDERARQVIDRADALPDDSLARLHGTMREVRGTPVADDPEWRELLNPAGDAPPDTASVDVGGVAIAKGSRVVLRPQRRADPIDMFVAGRVARVEGVYRDLEGRTYVAVVLDDDPAGDLHAEYGRFMYYGAEEIEPVGGPGLLRANPPVA